MPPLDAIVQTGGIGAEAPNRRLPHLFGRHVERSAPGRRPSSATPTPRAPDRAGRGPSRHSRRPRARGSTAAPAAAAASAPATPTAARPDRISRCSSSGPCASDISTQVRCGSTGPPIQSRSSGSTRTGGSVLTSVQAGSSICRLTTRPKAPFVGVVAEQHDRPREVGIRHLRHREQKDRSGVGHGVILARQGLRAPSVDRPLDVFGTIGSSADGRSACARRARRARPRRRCCRWRPPGFAAGP